ncbi:MAG TPA: STAS domain-containing protein [Bacteroidales bacterium]|nr:STAS domain-containing protein [Bacteroidales bacterium]
MKIITENNGSYKTIRLEGRLDTKAVADKEADILALLEEDIRNYLIDCEKIDYISSSGLRIFLKLQKQVSARQAKLILHSMPPNIYDIFKICNFTALFTIVDDAEAAKKLL